MVQLIWSLTCVNEISSVSMAVLVAFIGAGIGRMLGRMRTGALIAVVLFCLAVMLFLPRVE